MRQFKFGSAVLVSMILAGCGGGGGDLPAKPKFSTQVTFGDSLSDVGSYKVGAVAALGGGQFTINVPSTPTNWTELVAPQLGVAAPCAAQTGLDGDATQGFSVMPPTNRTGCTGYAQGGARVTNPVGVGNKLTGGANATIGMLTVPVVTQIQNFLAANGGSFKGNEIVFVMAGANDAFVQLATLSAGAKAAATAAVTAAVPAQIQADIASGACLPANAATTCATAAAATLAPTVGLSAANTYLATNSPQAVAAMATAATELSGYVNNQILANGAKYVAVMSIPDIASTPQAATYDANTKNLINQMIGTFNTTLKNGVTGNAAVLYVDAFGASHDEVANPGKYLLTNVTGTACNLTQPAPNPFASSLVCNARNLNAGVSATDHYLFADNVHPTPYGHSLFALYVLQAMTGKGWY